LFQPSKYFQRIRLAPYALSYQLTSPGSIATRWSTALGSNPLIIMTQDQTLAGRLHGIELTIQQSLSVCTGVQATTLPDALSAPSRAHYSRNPISLPASPPGVTGALGAHVVAVDASGSLIAGSMGGWSCTAPGPVQFMGITKSTVWPQL
jgi:hypothetical protein